MSTATARPVVKFASAAALLAALSLSSTLAAAQSASDDAAIARIVDFIGNDAHDVNAAILNSGYRPANPGEFARFAPVRQIETAFRSAESASPGGGRLLLASLARTARARYSAAGEDRALSPLFDHPELPITFADSGHTATALSEADRAIVLRLCDYLESGALGSHATVLQSYFDVPTRDAYDLLATSTTTVEAYERAMARLGTDEARTRMARLSQNLAQLYDSARHDPVIGALAGTIAPPSPRPRPPSDGIRPVDARERYARFVEAEYPEEADRTFRRMRDGSSGFGGVIVGAPVEAAPVAPRRVRYVARRQSIEVVLEDGTTATLEGIAPGVATAIRQVYSDGVGSDAVGLVGLQLLDATCDASGFRMGSARRVVLHPGAANTDFGWSLIMVDSVVGAPADAVARINAAFGAAAAERAYLDMSELTRDLDVVMYRTYDRSLRVSVTDGRLHVAAADDGDDIVFDIQGVHSDGSTSTHATMRVRQALRLLVATDLDFHNLQSFYRAAAVVRWASASGGRISWSGFPARASRVPTPRAIDVVNGEVTSLSEREMRARLDATAVAFDSCTHISWISDPLRAFARDVVRLLSRLESEVTEARDCLRAMACTISVAALGELRRVLRDLDEYRSQFREDLLREFYWLTITDADRVDARVRAIRGALDSVEHRARRRGLLDRGD